MNRKIFLLLSIFVSLIFLSSVSAANVDFSSNHQELYLNDELNSIRDAEEMISITDSSSGLSGSEELIYDCENFDAKKLKDSNDNLNNTNIIKPSSNTFKAINKAINQSKSNDTIFLEGVYDFDYDDFSWKNDIVINKDLIFEGNGGYIGESYGFSIYFNNSTVVFNDLTFKSEYSVNFYQNHSNLIFNNCIFDIFEINLFNYTDLNSLCFNDCVLKPLIVSINSGNISFINCNFNEINSFKIISDYVKIINSSFDRSYFNFIDSKEIDVVNSSFESSILSESFIKVSKNYGLENSSIEINTFNNESAKIVIAGDYSYTGVIQGKSFIPLENLKFGKYNITVHYLTDSLNITNEYNFSVVNGSLDNIEIKFPKQINSAEYIYSDEPYVSMVYDVNLTNVPLYFNGDFKFFIDGEENLDGFFNEEESEKNRLYYLSVDFEEGNHNLTVFYEGDDYFNPFNKTIEFYVAPITFNIYDNKIVFDHIYDAYGELVIKVNGEIYKNLTVLNSSYPEPVYHVTDGSRYYENYGHFILFNTSIIDLNLKDDSVYEIEVIYNGNYGKYITVDYLNLDNSNENENSGYYHIFVNNTYCEYNDDYILGKNPTQIFLPDIDDIYVKVTIDGEELIFNDTCINISNLSFGKHHVRVNYSGDNNYPSKSFDFTINVFAHGVLNTESDPNGIFLYNANEKVSISLTLPKDAVGNFTVYYKNGTKYKVYKAVEIKDGKASIAVKGIAGYIDYTKTIGLNFFKAKFIGNYAVKDEEFKIIFLPVVYDEKGYFNFITGEKGVVNLKISQYFYDYPWPIFNRTFSFGNYKLKNGVLKIPLSKFPIGSLGINYTFTSDSGNIIKGYYEFEKPTKLTLIASNLSMFYGDGSKYSIQLIDGVNYVKKGSVVKIKIASKTYKVKVGEKGWVKFKIDQLPGKYTVTASYKNKTIKNTATVKQILTLKKVTVKKYSKNLVLTASLKKVKGKYLNNKKITFDFNGKKYIVKTNSKGIAKVTISKSVLKKLKIGRKVTYSATYIKSTLKRTVKVKR